MKEDTSRKTYFAKADYRGKEQVFGIKALDRSKHIYVIGKTGMGKTVLLQNMAVQDIQNGNGMAFIDPHGEVTAALLDYVPEERVNDVIHFAPFDANFPISFNVMEDVGYDKRHLVVSGLISTFKKIWPDVWSARMEYILSNTLFALLEYPDSTLLDVNRMLVNKEFRKDVVDHITDPVIKSFWVDEFAKYTDRYTQEATPAIQNKIGQFVSNPLIRNIIGQPKSSFDFREAMDGKKILIINLSKGRIGDTNAKLIGSMLIIKIYLAAMSRADTTAAELNKLPPFYFFVDEFQSFANETFADILSESRKYKLSLTIAHQYIGQMPDEVREAVFGNVGTTIVFRVGAEDAEVLEKEFSPTFMAEDLVNLGYYQIYLKLMIDGLASKPFSSVTLPPIEKPARSWKEEVLVHSRETYARPRAEVESKILERHLSAPPPEKQSKKEKPYRESRLDTPRKDFQRPPEREREFRSPQVDEQKRAPMREPAVAAPLRPPARNAWVGERSQRGGRVDEQPVHQPFKKAFNATYVDRRNDGRPPRTERTLRGERPTSQRIYEKRQEPITSSQDLTSSNRWPRERVEQPVSLSSLRPNSPQKESVSQNADELRKTLKEALQAKEQEIPTSGSEARGARNNRQETANDKEPITNDVQQKPNVQEAKKEEPKNIPEIPEDELKKMLDMSSGDERNPK
ncbi:MAG: type IV secretory system conjugative DNA transfer family protein [Parcubacteria group bacterium]|nr:type IV secretory system conjugative DNA transfer family protein [Parcubacteria group bacterium]